MMRFVLVAAVLAGCSHPPRPPMTTSDCAVAIQGFASADPARFRALPRTCTLDDVNRALHPLGSTSVGMLAHRNERMTIHWFSSEKLPEIHAWVDAAGHVVLLDADTPPGSADAYVSALGAPEVRLDYRWHASVLKQAEMLWLGRGTVVVADPGVKGLVRVGVFAPASLEDYKAQLQFVDIEDSDEG
jgi:hypothetical protein